MQLQKYSNQGDHRTSQHSDRGKMGRHSVLTHTEPHIFEVSKTYVGERQACQSVSVHQDPGLKVTEILKQTG